MADPTDIHIKSSRRGEFTRQALAHHEGVQEFASHVLAHPEDFSEATEKRAQFAHNASEFNNGHPG